MDNSDLTMAKKEHISETPATQFLRKHKVAFSEHPYNYEEHGGTGVSSRELGVDEHHVVKTLVMQDEAAKPSHCADARRLQGLDQESGAQHRLQVRRTVQAGRGVAPQRLHDRRYFAVWHQEDNAGVCRG